MLCLLEHFILEKSKNFTVSNYEEAFIFLCMLLGLMLNASFLSFGESSAALRLIVGNSSLASREVADDILNNLESSVIIEMVLKAEIKVTQKWGFFILMSLCTATSAHCFLNHSCRKEQFKGRDYQALFRCQF